jgi:hypothetical protein
MFADYNCATGRDGLIHLAMDGSNIDLYNKAWSAVPPSSRFYAKNGIFGNGVKHFSLNPAWVMNEFVRMNDEIIRLRGKLADIIEVIDEDDTNSSRDIL